MYDYGYFIKPKHGYFVKPKHDNDENKVERLDADNAKLEAENAKLHANNTKLRSIVVQLRTKLLDANKRLNRTFRDDFEFVDFGRDG